METIDVKTPKCWVCGKEGLVCGVPREGFQRWMSGELIQNALPELSADDRQQLLDGVHGPCFDALLPYDDEDEDEDYEDDDEDGPEDILRDR